MRHYFATFHETLLDLWSHKLTGFIGSTTLLFSLLDWGAKFAGLAAVVISCHCSIAREKRDKRESEARLAAIQAGAARPQ